MNADSATMSTPATPSKDVAASPPRRRKRSVAARLGLTAILGGLAALSLVAFADFVRDVNALAAPSPVEADGIVVVTGGQARIEVALQLLEDGAAQRLLISGVHDATSATVLVERTHADPSLFECCVDLDRAAMDTAGNARETATWAQEHAFSSLLVVTSAYHIPRTTSEIARLLPGVELIPFPIDPAVDNQRATAQESNSWPVSLLAREFMKLQLARVRHLVGAAG
ncbi:MAG: YdcF family protein [Hyphomicrobiales bacterium]